MMSRSKNFLDEITLLVFVFLVSPVISHASTQGVFYTPNEVAVWQARAQQGPYLNKGDAWVGSPGDWQRILANANGFLSNPELPLTNAKDPFRTTTINRVGIPVRDAAFVYLVTSQAEYGEAVRNWILTVVRDPTNDITLLPPVYATLPDGSRNTRDAYLNHGMTVARLAMIYDFTKDFFSAVERGEVEAWLLSSALYFEKYVHSGGLNVGDEGYGHAGLIANFPNRKSDDYSVRSGFAARDATDPNAWLRRGAINTEEVQPDGTIRCVTTTLSTPLTENYAYVRADGTSVNRLSTLSQYYNNRRAVTVLTFGLIGVLLDNPDLKNEAKRYVKEWLRYGVWPDGSQGEYARNGDYCSEGQGMLYGASNAQAAALLAEALTRQGDSELYQYSSVWGLFGSGVSETQTDVPPGSPAKTIWDAIQTHLQLVDGALDWYQHEAWKTQQEPRAQTHIDGINEFTQFGAAHTYHELSYLPANRYYRSALMRNVVLRSPDGAGHPPFPGTDGLRVDGGLESWNGVNSLFPGILFMYADSVADLNVAIIDSPDPALLGQTVDYTVTVTNNGPYPATHVTASGTLLSCDFATIPSGTSSSCIRSDTATSVGTLSQSMSVSAAEVDRNPVSNTATASTTVVAPDLVPTAFTGNKSGARIIVSDTVKNQGAGNAGPFTVAYYLSTNTDYEAGADLPLASNSDGSGACARTVMSLAPNAISSVTRTTCYKPFTAVTGTRYYILVVDDAANTVVESIETNNIWAASGQVWW